MRELEFARGQDAAQDVSGTWAPLRQAAPQLGLSREALLKRVRRGSVSARKVGGRWQVRVDMALDVPTTVQDPVPDAYTAHLEAEIAYLRSRVEVLEGVLLERARRPWWRFWG